MPLNRGVLRLPQATLHYLRARDYADALCEYGGGAFLHGMTPDDAIDFLTARATALGRAVRLAGPFVPALSEPALMKLAAFLNPGRSSVKQILQTAAARRQAQKAGGAAAAAGAGGTRLTNGRPGGKHDDEDGADETNNGDLINGSRQPTSDPVALAGSEPVDAISLVELYLEVLLALQRRRDAADKYKYDLATYAPWHLQPATLLTGLTGTFEEFGILANREGTGVTDLDASGLAVRAFSVDADVARSHNRLDEGLAYGRQHGAAITRAGDLFTWGKASGGRLGHGGIIEEGSYMPPLRVETLNMHGIRVQGVACGAEHTLARTDHGVFAWGANDHGQLGLDDTEMRTHPQQVPTLGDDVHMSSVVCGGFHSMVGRVLMGEEGDAIKQYFLYSTQCWSLLITGHGPGRPYLGMGRQRTWAAGAAHGR